MFNSLEEHLMVSRSVRRGITWIICCLAVLSLPQADK
jgi:hypothetical protein